VDTDARVIGFREKPETPPVVPWSPGACLASMGIYIFDTDVLVQALRRDSETDSGHDFGGDIVPGLVAAGERVFAYLFWDENKKEAQYWRDVGTLDAYYEANMDLVSVTPLLNLYDRTWPIFTVPIHEPPPKFVFGQEHPGGRLGVAIDSLVSPGCIISGGRVSSSILSPDVRINSYSNVHASLLFEGVNVGRHAKVRRAIIDKDVTIPEGMEIGYNLDEDRKKFTVSDAGIVVISKRTIL
jgi:glucose-1-phosphate adenylyltransferase